MVQDQSPECLQQDPIELSFEETISATLPQIHSGQLTLEISCVATI